MYLKSALRITITKHCRRNNNSRLRISRTISIVRKRLHCTVSPSQGTFHSGRVPLTGESLLSLTTLTTRPRSSLIPHLVLMVGFYLLIKDKNKKQNSSLLLNSIPFLLSSWKYLGLYWESLSYIYIWSKYQVLYRSTSSSSFNLTRPEQNSQLSAT